MGGLGRVSYFERLIAGGIIILANDQPTAYSLRYRKREKIHSNHKT